MDCRASSLQPSLHKYSAPPQPGIQPRTLLLFLYPVPDLPASLPSRVFRDYYFCDSCTAIIFIIKSPSLALSLIVFCGLLGSAHGWAPGPSGITKTLFQKLFGLKWAISCKKILIRNIFGGALQVNLYPSNKTFVRDCMSLSNELWCSLCARHF